MNKKQWRLRPFPGTDRRPAPPGTQYSSGTLPPAGPAGVCDFEDAKAFFRPDLSALHDPYLMKDMTKAVDRILEALEKAEKILVFGDYDVDGTTSVAIMMLFLRGIYSPGLLDFYIPHRYREGYAYRRPASIMLIPPVFR